MRSEIHRNIMRQHAAQHQRNKHIGNHQQRLAYQQCAHNSMAKSIAISMARHRRKYQAKKNNRKAWRSNGGIKHAGENIAASIAWQRKTGAVAKNGIMAYQSVKKRRSGIESSDSWRHRSKRISEKRKRMAA